MSIDVFINIYNMDVFHHFSVRLGPPPRGGLPNVTIFPENLKSYPPVTTLLEDSAQC